MHAGHAPVYLLRSINLSFQSFNLPLFLSLFMTYTLNGAGTFGPLPETGGKTFNQCAVSQSATRVEVESSPVTHCLSSQACGAWPQTEGRGLSLRAFCRASLLSDLSSQITCTRTITMLYTLDQQRNLACKQDLFALTFFASSDCGCVLTGLLLWAGSELRCAFRRE